jgi:hypothetical protein
VGVVECLLVLGGPASADDTNDVLIALRPDHEHEPLLDGPDGDEPLLEIGVRFVVKLEVVRTGCEQLRRLLEGNAMPLAVGEVLGFIPSDLHQDSVSRWLSKSTAYNVQ